MPRGDVIREPHDALDAGRVERRLVHTFFAPPSALSLAWFAL